MNMKPRQLLDKLASVDLRMTDSGTRHLVPYDDYLTQIQNDFLRELIRLILKNTKYIDFETLYKQLLESVQILKTQRFILYFPLHEKIGSENWLTALVWNEIKDNCIGILTNLTDVVDIQYPIVIIDDCVYTGCNVAGIIDEYTYNVQKSSFIVVTPYMTTSGQQTIMSLQQSVTFAPHIIIDSFYQIPEIYDLLMTKDLLIDTSKLHDFMYSSLGSETVSMVPIYFDHKVANEFSSFPQIYLKGWTGQVPYGPLIHPLPSRHKITEVQCIIFDDTSNKIVEKIVDATLTNDKCCIS